MDPLHLSLLGEFRVLVGETPVTTLDLPRLQSLLAYLVLHHTAPQARNQLAFVFWQESTDAQARTNLRNLVFRLHRALPEAEHFLHSEQHTLQWQPTAPWTLDVQGFEAALAHADQAEKNNQPRALREALATAVERYRGDLLPGCYEEWVFPERERLRQRLLQALERLLLLQEAERDYPTAISTAQQTLRQDPLLEATYRHLMRLYAVSGDRAAAVRTYHACASILERELGVTPSPETYEAYARLLHMEGRPGLLSPQPPALSAGMSLVGRQPEWTELQRAWQQASAGHPQLVVLTGEAGMGKTRLAEELVAWVERQGMTTASARAYVAEGELTYAPVIAWLRSAALRSRLPTLANVWRTEVARLVPELLAGPPDLPPATPLAERWHRQRLFEALARTILEAPQPLLLVLDDVQWCDQETLAWLPYVLRFDPGARLLLVGTLRPEEIAADHPLMAVLLGLRRTDQVTEISLGPLDATDTATLAAQVAGRALDPTWATTLYQETEGNPLFVVELARLECASSEACGRQSGSKTLPPPGTALPPTVQAVIARRLARLSPSAGELVGLAATIGRAFTFPVLAAASQSDEERLVRDLDELWQKRIIREQGTDAYDFSHDKLREGAYLALSAARRRLLHRRVAEALEAVYASGLDEVRGQIAAHYAQAGLPVQAIRSPERTGDRVQGIRHGSNLRRTG